jgi:hypothetical protein
MSKYSINEKIREARDNEGGYIWKKNASGKVVPVPVYDEETAEDEANLQEATRVLEQYTEDNNLLEKAGVQKETSGVRKSNQIINSAITMTVENPKVASALEEIRQESGKPWHSDPDCVGSVVRIVKKNYAQFNFTEKQLIDAVRNLYGG